MRSLAATLACWIAASAASGAETPPGMLLPLQDRAGDGATAELVRTTIEAELAASLAVADATALRDRLRRLRIRDASLADPQELARLGEAFGTRWFLSVTIHRVQGAPEPQIALSGWAVDVGERTLRWCGFHAASGRDTYRAFGRGAVQDPAELVVRASRSLIRDFVEPERRSPRRGAKARRDAYREPGWTAEQLGAVAVLPFESLAEREAILASETVTALARATLHRRGVSILHPGLLRTVLLPRGAWQTGRLDGYGRGAVRVAGGDTIVTGTVEHFGLRAGGERPDPRVAFSVRLIEPESGRIVGIAGLDRTGEYRRKLFDRGRVYAPGALAEEMMTSLIQGLLRS